MEIHEDRALDIVQLTINNKCNLACPHCYLNVSGGGYLPEEMLTHIFREPPAKLAIVGMEPFYDEHSASIVKQAASLGHTTETSVSVVTNGLGLKHLYGVQAGEMPHLIDISLDGGPKHYVRFRGAGHDHFPRIVAHAAHVRSEHPELIMSALHTLWKENANPDVIADMIAGGNEVVTDEGTILFSPFTPPRIEAGQRVPDAHRLSLANTLDALRRTDAFMAHPKAFFFAGVYNAEAFGMSFDELRGLVDSYGLIEKARLDEGVPHENGGIRVNWNGTAIRPDYSIHTSLYKGFSVPIGMRSLVDLYEQFRKLPALQN